MAETFVNDFATTLNGAINSAVTSLSVNDSPPSGLTANFRIRIDDEFMLVTAIGGTGNKDWTVTREAEESSRFPAASHSNAAAVTHVYTVGALAARTIATDVIWDAKGDLAGGTGADTAAKLTVGTNDQILVAASGEATGLQWQGGAWTDYTPTLTAVTTNPTLGSSTVSGRFKLISTKLGIVAISMVVTTGGAWNAGSGEWKFSLPAGWTAGTGEDMIGSCTVLDSGTARFAGICIVLTGGTVIHPIVMADSTSDRTLKHNNPVTWATGDSINLTVMVELA